ncbi:MBL fold metallo-hydrolase [Bdellovibrio reynosensis]|uniref:MBL fold metallo-hydrolase n=1 Tax=Bdellovibrio reynosensis TaxID=2835041 RepID=A0ABY4C6U1_9BACT|nr:MBL fold metallo-hydrolase [Bdellovibrio reynosensis]UOF00635.1 MBL fold metallo-hydrolase [Bdellovibrio reynosensis]
MPLKISRILHAGYVFDCDGTKIAFDPIFENPFSRNCYAFPSVRFDIEAIKQQKFSAVFISHYHDDHCSLESLNLLDRDTPIYIYCLYDEIFGFIENLGFKNVFPLAIDEPVKLGSLEIIPRRALDADVDSLFQIKAAGLNVLNVVDSWIDYDTLDLLVKKGPWDMVLWPFQTMREIDVLSPHRVPAPSLELPPEWIEQLRALNPRYVVPSSCQFTQESWSWYNHAFFPITYRQFEKEVKTALPNCQVVRMNPSVTFELTKNSINSAEALTWVLPQGEQDVDYEFNPSLKIPSTAEIAKKFPGLSVAQKEFTLNYCKKGLIEKFGILAESEDPFFARPRLWQLSVFDENGKEKTFRYLLEGNKIEEVPINDDPIEWLTEVPLTKLYAAIEEGESLTSMYVRINDRMFNSTVEKEVQEADVVEDPLIRCLFTGVFGGYQAAQLRKLNEEKVHG